jgi:hypothetical protein
MDHRSRHPELVSGSISAAALSRWPLATACAALSLAGCGQSGGAVGNATPSVPVANAAAPVPVPTPQPTATSACARAPALALSEDFADPRHAFAPTTVAFRRLETDFAAAYRSACERGVLRGHPLIAAGAAERDGLRLRNAPEANIASIYLDGEEGAPAAQRHVVLEYPFLTGDGATHTPSAAELGEAIFCSVQGASEQEEEASGRCLPD